MANDDLTQWLRQRLSQERELLEKRHNALLDEFQEHLNQETQCCTLLSPEMIAVQMEVEEMVTSPVNDPGTGEDQPANEAEVQGRVDQVVDVKKNSPGKKLQAALSFISAQRPRSIPDTFMAQLVTSRGFEFFFAAMIFLNMVEMALEMQYEGFSSGFQLGYPGYPKPKEDTWPGMKSVFRIASWVFGIAYTIEVICKLLGLRSSFFF